MFPLWYVIAVCINDILRPHMVYMHVVQVDTVQK